MAASAKVIDLRKLLAERFPHSPQSTGMFLATGLPFLDEAIGGGLPKNVITELISPQMSAGSASLIHALLHIAQRDRYYVALIDGRDSFDPQSQAQQNACLNHLLWVRCTTAMHAIKATDLLLRDGNFPMLVLDLILNPPEELRKIPQTSWYRLQRLVEASSMAFLVLTQQSMVASAQLKIVLNNSWKLETCDEADAVSQLRFHIQRSHLKPGERRAACDAIATRRRVGAEYLEHDSACPSLI
jgi:recA bacterial DNA recombination protein